MHSKKEWDNLLHSLNQKSIKEIKMTHLLGISSNDPKTSNEAWDIAKKIVDEMEAGVGH